MKLLVAFDAEEHSVLALDKAVEVAEAEGAEVTVLSVVPPSARGSKSGGHMGLPPHADQDVAYAEKYLGDRGVRAGSKIAQGHPADEIVREARSGDFRGSDRGRDPGARLCRRSPARQCERKGRSRCSVSRDRRRKERLHSDGGDRGNARVREPASRLLAASARGATSPDSHDQVRRALRRRCSAVGARSRPASTRHPKPPCAHA